MSYVDGFVIVMPKKNLKVYQTMARKAGKIWKEYGAIDYVECVGDDLRVQKGMGVGFKKMAKAKPGDAVVFSYITYKSKTQRNEVNKKVMKDKRIANMCDPKNMPFDMKRFAYGGFTSIVEM